VRGVLSGVGMWSRERESRLGAFERKLTTLASKGREQVN
jgi:hypothetical protein